MIIFTNKQTCEFKLILKLKYNKLQDHQKLLTKLSVFIYKTV